MDLLSHKQFRWPSLAQWKQLPSVLTSREKLILGVLTTLFLFSSFSLTQGLYLSNTTMVPAQGGSIREGIVGSPRFLNPVYADTNDTDRDLVQLLYSGILRSNAQGQLMPDLASSPPIVEEGGKVVSVSLQEDVQWHDGAPFTADDVVFTVKTIQDAAYKSPIRANWLGVDVEKVSDYKVRFHLIDAYAPFLERLTLKILPAHLWKDIPPENFALTPLNLQPIGTGPYRLVNIVQERSGQVTELQLKASDGYHGEGPFIESFAFRFFQTEEELIREANRGGIQSFALSQLDTIQRMKNPAFSRYAFSLPRYFALFFNLDAPANQKELEQRDVREALVLALDKQELVSRVFRGNARIVNSPFLPKIFGFGEATEQQPNLQGALTLLEEQGYVKEQDLIGKPRLTDDVLARDLQKGDTGEDVRRLQQCLANPPSGGPDIYPEGIVNGSFGTLTYQAVIRFQEQHTTETLTPLGLTKGTGKAGPLTRAKLNALCFASNDNPTPLTISITTVDRSPLKDVAAELKRQWEAFGLQVQVQTFSATALERDVLQPRAYQTLLFGEVLGTIPDPFPFWHSTQAQTPGLNLSAYENKQVDKLLEDARKEFDPIKRLGYFAEAQERVLQDVPAIFLYDVDYQYFISAEVRGVQTPVIADPSQRFAAVTEWYAKTKRAPK